MQGFVSGYHCLIGLLKSSTYVMVPARLMYSPTLKQNGLNNELHCGLLVGK